MRLILASASIRRAEVLRNAGLHLQVLSSAVDETPLPGEAATALVRRLAEAKAELVAARAIGPAIIVAAGTTIALDGRILGKPRSSEEVRSMLRQLSGRTYPVHTGLALVQLPDMERRSAVETTLVTFSPLTDAEITQYLASGEPFDKAGAYAIQGHAGRFIPRIEGDYFNVVGLPLARLYHLLRELGWGEE